MNCNSKVLGCGAKGQERRVTNLGLFWSEEYEYLMELGEGMDRSLFSSKKVSRSKKKALALSSEERRKVFCLC